MDFHKRYNDIVDNSDVRTMQSAEFLKFMLDSCDDSYKYVHDRCNGGIEGCSREELRDYYIALGRYDMCMEALYLMCSRLVELDCNDVTGLIDRVKKLGFVYQVPFMTVEECDNQKSYYASDDVYIGLMKACKREVKKDEC